MGLSDSELQKLRETSRNIGERAIKDPVFKAKLRSDPAGTLTELGVPAEVIPDVVREAGLSDVAGYGANVGPCIISCPALTVSI